MITPCTFESDYTWSVQTVMNFTFDETVPANFKELLGSLVSAQALVESPSFFLLHDMTIDSRGSSCLLRFTRTIVAIACEIWLSVNLCTKMIISKLTTHRQQNQIVIQMRYIWNIGITYVNNTNQYLIFEDRKYTFLEIISTWLPPWDMSVKSRNFCEIASHFRND